MPLNFKSLTAKLQRRITLSHLVPYLAGEFGRQQTRVQELDRRVKLMQEALGRIEARQSAAMTPLADPLASLQQHEFRVYSQWGEDGIIDHLVRSVPIARKFFVEFGVESYEESNTRFLLQHRNWSGLVMDGSQEQVAQIARNRLRWFHDLNPVQAFITRENIDGLLNQHDAAGDIGLLSIDIDGMDWWVWDAVACSRPAIVVVEYNHRFGSDVAVTVPYKADFDRRAAHHSICYYGASLAAFERLGRRKGYDLVGCGSAGLNAFFVRSDLRPDALPQLTAQQAFVEGQFCEMHDEQGQRIKTSNAQQREMIMALPLVEIAEDGTAVRAT